MKTFQDRARVASSDFDPYGEEKEPFEEGYIVGATEQQEIDINKACSVLRDILVFEFGLKEDDPIDKDCIAGDIEKLHKAMKGE